MANKKIKGLTVEIGGDATELGKALDNVESKARDLSSELGQINKLLKMDPGNADLLAQKQKVLADAVAETSKKLDILKEAEKQVQAQFERGEASEEQVRALQREIIETTNKLGKYEQAARETETEIKNLGNTAEDAGDDFDDLADSAEDAGDSMEDAGDQADKTGDKMDGFADTLEKGATAGLMGLVGAATAAVGALVGCVEATEEYRKAMGQLDTAFTTSGHSSETAYETYSDLQAVLGETDQAVEAASLLAKFTDNERDLEKMTRALTGVYATFGASLPVEALAESANESARNGQVAGNLADALNWAAKEGETFGVKLKDNIEFTKLSEQELKNLTDTQRAEYEARKAQYDAIEEWNKAVEDATTAEEYFNLALQECSTEQERQELIIETLTGLYGDASDAYEEINEDVLAANAATEKLNNVWADVGKKATPIVTTFKEGIAKLGEAVVESLSTADVKKFQDTISGGFDKLAKSVIPKLIDALEWVLDNLDVLTALAKGFIAALVASKILSFARTLTTELLPAITAVISGQEKLNATMKANVFIAVASAVIGLATALTSLWRDNMQKAEEKAVALAEQMYGLTEAEKEAAERTQQAADAFRDQREAMSENLAETESQFAYLTTLKDELLKLADASGTVTEKDRARAEFILGQLNEALGTEYTMVGNQIQNYKDLAASIDEVMEKKKAELLLAASEDAYAEAVANKAQVERDYYQHLNTMLELTAEREAKMQEQRELNRAWEEETNLAKKLEIAAQIENKSKELQAIQNALNEEQIAYATNKETLRDYYDTIGQYETASRLSLEGKVDEASKVLSDLSYYYENYVADVGLASDEVQNKWELQVIDAGVKAAKIKENWENGVAGYTEKMVQDAEEGYENMLAAYADAYSDAEGVGEDMADGAAAGMLKKKASLLTSARDLVASAISAMKKEADSNSPSKKTMAFGEDMGEGAEIGLDNKTDDLVKVAGQQVSSILDAYNSQERQSATVLQGLNEQALNRSSAAMQSAAASNGPVLEKILAAIEAGQVLAIDGKTLVGATVGRTDAALGQQRELVARGAK